MKNIFNILIIVGVLFISSCDDRLDLTPYDGLPEDEVFSTPGGFENAIRGVYNGFKADGYYGESSGYNISPEIASDNLSFCTAGRQTKKALFEWRNTALDQSFFLYGRGYKIISRANNILENLDKLADNEFRDNIEGEALALRALVHFDMARIYCQIPTQNTSAGSSLGIYYANSFSPEESPVRSGTTVNGVYDLVEADLLNAADLINENNPVGRLNKAAVYGLLSRFYLHKGDYDACVQYSDLAIASGVPVAPREEFENIWYDEYDDNILLKILVTDADDWRPGVPFSQENADKEIRSEYVCSYELYQLFSSNDIRLEASVVTSEYNGVLYNHVKKHLGRKSGDKNVIDGKYLRIEEVYLNKAEAIYRSGGSAGTEAEALAALDAVRDERYSPAVAGGETGAALLDAIMLERRLEFAFESDRFFTLKRLGMDLTRTNDGDRADGSGTPALVQSYPASGFRWQAPIPQGAIDANPDLEQNPGY